MQRTLRTLALALGLLAGTTSCGGDFVSAGGDDEPADGEPIEINEQLLGVFSAPTSRTLDTDSVSHLLIRPDGTARWTHFSGCRENDSHQSVREYEWRPEGYDKIVITDPSGGNIVIGGAEAHVTPGRNCNEIRVGRIGEDGTEFGHHRRDRGELCLFASECDFHGCKGCKVSWCNSDERPEPCE
jgi:hypothetical protein